MGKARFHRPEGWKASGGPYGTVTSRQIVRHSIRYSVWASMSGINAQTDDYGIIPRRIRREMARLVAKKQWVSGKAR